MSFQRNQPDVSNKNSRSYVITAKGPRDYMEDTYTVDNVGLKKTIKFLGVFDGHGGSVVSEMLKKSFSSIFTQSLLRFNGDIAVALRNSFSLVDQLADLNNSPTTGSTAAISLIDKDKVWFANAGDSMSMVIYNDGTSEMMSFEHKVGNESEIKRMERSGGVITYDDGVARIFRTLNVSRSIGDHYMKTYVISDPFIKVIKRNKVKYIVIASDGIWDVYNNLTLTTDIEDCLLNNSKEDMLKEIVNRAYNKGSMDNITLMITEL
jgi:serine/threonine protein phosphatase PrpC